jgi:hypothetical protein
MLAGSGLMLGTSLWVLNQSGMFRRSPRFSPQFLYALGHRLMTASQNLGERTGILQRQPLLNRLWSGRSATLNVKALKDAKERVSHASDQAISAIRDGINDTRIQSARIAKEHPTATIGSGLLVLGLLAAALMMPGYRHHSSTGKS